MNKIIIIAMRIRSGLKKENEKEIYGIAKGRELKKKKLIVMQEVLVDSLCS